MGKSRFMTKKEFKYAMQRGLGRCVLELQCTDHIEKYRDIVLWGCMHELAYDAQCEGSRSFYLYEIIQLFPDVMPFLEAAAKRMHQCVTTTGWEFGQHCKLLALFAGDGNVFAIHALQQCYENLLGKLKRKRKRTKQGLFPERDNFEELCICIATYSSDVSVCMERYLAIVSDIGSLVSSNSLFIRWDFDWFQAACESSLGKQRVIAALKRRAEHSGEVHNYITAMDAEKTSWNQNRAKRSNEIPVTAEDVYEQLSEGKRAGSTIPLFLVRRMQKSGREQEVQKLGAYYTAGTSEPVRIQLLKLLANRDCSYVLDTGQLISDSKSSNVELQDYAFQALGTIKKDLVYAYALELVSDQNRRADVIDMLAANYDYKDRELFVNLVKSIPVSYDDGEWHQVFSSVMDIFEDKSIKNPPKELLFYMYENTLCSFCRCVVVKEMGHRRMLTDEILQECMHDSSSEIREYAGKRLEYRKTRF